MIVTATAVVDQIDLGDHVCWTHDEEIDGLDAVGRFVATGRLLDLLRKGGPVGRRT